MIKLIGRILMIVLALSLVSGGMYFWVQSGSSRGVLTAGQDGIRSRTVLNADFNGGQGGFQGRLGGDREAGGSLAAGAAGILRNLIVVGVITLGVVILQKFFRTVVRKRKIPERVV